MRLIKYIENDKVNKIATRLIKKSKKILLLTMILQDEVNTVSQKYIKLINEKVNKGTRIHRIGFGNRKDFKKALIIYNSMKSRKNFIFKLSTNMQTAQRLLISDKKEMIFAVYLNKKDKLVFYTKSKEIVNGFINYFNNIFDKIR